MLKHELHESGYMQYEKNMTYSLMKKLWAVFTLSIMFITFWLAWFSFLSVIMEPIAIGMGLFVDVHISIQFFIFAVLAIYAHLIITRFIMTLFCKNKAKGVGVRVKDTVSLMPTCYCREALKPGQYILTYTLSIFVIYTALFVFWFFTLATGIFISILFFMIFVTPDIVLTFYIIYIKATQRPEYISVDDHIYLTLYFPTHEFERKNKKKKLNKA